ncbi:hypothetical protein PG996_004290 [Apiospora saccharicola]|uniref:Biogenesis of lysosome-related organelles complex 1 subunit 1 n=1 Tax=Apiospora saccharicola TaxID=335842 RepID=A0ABR1W3Q5_9PEZI
MRVRVRRRLPPILLLRLSHPLSPRTSMVQAMATTVTASGTTSIPSPSSTTGIFPSPALSSPGFPSYATSSASRPGGSSAAAVTQQQQTPRSHTGPPPSNSSGANQSQAAAGKRPAAGSIANTNTTSASNSNSMPPHLHAHLPSTTTTLHMTEARDALVATMSNLFDTELQSRASLLHANATQLSRQEADVAKATESLRKENDKLAKVAREAGKRIKETGNVQNWAEVLERDFLVLEETLRLAREGDGESEGGYTSSSGSCWSGSGSDDGGDAGSGNGGGTTRSRRASVDRGREEGAVVAAKVAGKATAAAPPPTLDGEGGLVGAVNEMDIDDAVGAGAAVPASSTEAAGKTVEDVVVQEVGTIGGRADDQPSGAMDVDVDMANTSDTPAAATPAPSKDDGQEETGGPENGPFSHVDNAIEASIREAMATSMHDETAAGARSETTLEGGSTSSVHRKAKEIAEFDKMDLDASERSFPSTGRTLSRESVSVSDVASGSGPPPPAAT